MKGMNEDQATKSMCTAVSMYHAKDVDLLKKPLDNSDVSHGQHHNLPCLFTDLPESHRVAVEQKATKILNSEWPWAWDVAETVDSLLTYLGRNAITDTRYFWESSRSHVGEEALILFAARMLQTPPKSHDLLKLYLRRLLGCLVDLKALRDATGKVLGMKLKVVRQ